MRGIGKATIELIAACRTVLEEIQPASVRAVCYKLFALGYIPDMSINSTNHISRVLVRAREDGEIPWEHIVDGTRIGLRRMQWKDPNAFLEDAKSQYARDCWADQDYHVELWSEKSTVEGVLESVWTDFGITFRSFKGFSSATVVKAIADVSAAIEKPFMALYVGDWDPSGMYMSEVDLPARLKRYGGQVEVVRIALLEDDTHELPSFSTHSKRGDARYKHYLDRYGTRCWELDAMNPNTLRERAELCIRGLIDPRKWSRMRWLETQEREIIRQYFDRRDFTPPH